MKDTKIIIKKTLVFAMVIVIVFACFAAILGNSFSLNNSLFADNSTLAPAPPTTPPSVVSTTLFKKETSTKYYYFQSPTAIFANQDNYFVSHNNNIIDTFSINDNTLTATFTTLNTPKKIEKNENLLFSLEGEELCYYSGNIRSVIVGSFIDFDICDAKLYALTLTEIIEFDLTKETVSLTKNIPLNFKTRATNIAAGLDSVFIASVNKFNANKTDISIYTPSSGVVTRDVIVIDRILKMNVAPQLSALACLNELGLALYSPQFGGLILKQNIAVTKALDFAVSPDGFLCLTTDNAVKFIAKDGGASTELLASSSNQSEFYSLPSSAISRKGNVIVADSLNNRVIVSSKTETKKIAFDFFLPASVTSDHIGNIYVAYSVNKIAVIDPTFTTVKELVFSGITTKIRQIVMTSSSNLFALTTDNNLFVKNKGEANFVLACDKKVEGIATASDTPELYAAIGDSKILVLGGKEEKEITTPYANGSVFCVDKARNFFFVENGIVYRHFLNSENYEKTDAYSYEKGEELSPFISSIFLSTINQPQVKCGDIIIADSEKHCVRILSKEDFGVEITSGGTPPSIDSETAPSKVDNSKRLIRTINENCEVYATESEIDVIGSLSKDFKVIVPTLNTSGAFSLVIADNTTQNNTDKAIVGYVYNDFLSEPLEYTSPVEKTCRVWSFSLPIYKYPTRNSPTLDGYKEIKKDTSLKLLDFCYSLNGKDKVYGLDDNFSKTQIKWYKVCFGENDQFEGYIMQDGVSVRGSNPDPTIRPQFNAVIISDDVENDKIPATTYELVNGKYLAINAPSLPCGTKVEVVNAFNSSVPFTLIRYSTEFGTVECFVKTSNLQYQGVNVVTIVVIFALVITVVIFLIVLIKINLDKKRTLCNNTQKPSDPGDGENLV